MVIMFKPKPAKSGDFELFTYEPKVNLSWEEIKTSWEGYFETTDEIDFFVTKRSIQDALKDISKLCTNKTYPIDELSKWEKKFKYWLTLFDSSAEVCYLFIFIFIFLLLLRLQYINLLIYY